MLSKVTMLCNSGLSLTAAFRSAAFKTAAFRTAAFRTAAFQTVPFRTAVFRWTLKSGSTLAVAVLVLPSTAAVALADSSLIALPSSSVLVSDYKPGNSEPVPPVDDSTTSTSGDASGTGDRNTPSNDAPNGDSPSGGASEPGEERTVGTSSSAGGHEDALPESATEAQTPSQTRNQ